MFRKPLLPWVVLGLLVLASGLAAVQPESPPPMHATGEVRETLLDVYQSNLAKAKNLHTGLLPDLFVPEFDEVLLSEDGKTAMIWIALRDPDGSIVATEPGLILARLEDAGWRMIFPGDSEWDQTLLAFPTKYIPAEHSPIPNGDAPKSSQVEALTGYYLPYVAGTKRWLEASVLHFNYFPERGYPSCKQSYCQYAYDFTDSDHFPLLASKDGTVVASRDSCVDGTTACTNYIILDNSADSYYQLYFHLANGTIPDKLSPGSFVKRGQYIGDTDDTGYSTSQHVHFMVTNSWWWAGDGYPWGNSVDIRFADVAINSGIPRTCYEVTNLPIFDGATECLGNTSVPLNPNNDWYTSGNTGAFPPNVSWTRPTEAQVVVTGTGPLMDVTATISDDVHIHQITLFGNIDGAWKVIPKYPPGNIIPDGNGVANWDVNLCDLGPLNGTLQLQLKVSDHEGNVTTVNRIVTVDHACAPPVSAMLASTTYDSSAVKLNWTVSPSTSGLSKFELQARPVGRDWSAGQNFTLGMSKRSAWFVGAMGTGYEFRLRAFDNNGQAEAWPMNDLSEQSVVFPASCVPDVGEPDNSAQTATPLALNTTANRNFCTGGDVDWFRLDTSQWPHYLISTTPKGATGATVNLSVYAPNGTTLLKKVKTVGLFMPTNLFLIASQQPFVYIKAESNNPNLAGNQVQYSIVAKPQYVNWLPMILK